MGIKGSFPANKDSLNMKPSPPSAEEFCLHTTYTTFMVVTGEVSMELTFHFDIFPMNYSICRSIHSFLQNAASNECPNHKIKATILRYLT